MPLIYDRARLEQARETVRAIQSDSPSAKAERYLQSLTPEALADLVQNGSAYVREIIDETSRLSKI
jgi:hypothetical protein